jgi:pseudoazurin
MFFKMVCAATFVLGLTGPAQAETFEVQMLNKGEAGIMVFEPALVRLAPGDSVRFVATDKGHNAEIIDDMLPEGATAFSGKINEELTVTPDQAGFYGVRCTPHFAMGMVMVIVVGDGTAPPAEFLEGRLPKKAKERLEAALAGL